MADAPRRWFDRMRGRATLPEPSRALKVRVSADVVEVTTQALADLERGQLFVPALEAPRVGHRVELDVEIEQDSPRRVEALVIWAKPPRPGSAGGFGARIESPPATLLEALQAVARRARERAVAPSELTTLALGLREHSRDSSPPPLASSPNIRSDPSKRSKPPAPRPLPRPMKRREAPPVPRLAAEGDDIEAAAAALARQLEAGLPSFMPTRSHVERPRDDHATMIVVDDSAEAEEEEELPLPPPPPPVDVLLEETRIDVDVALDDSARDEPAIALPDDGDDTVQTDTSLHEQGDVEVSGEDEPPAPTPVPPAPAPVVFPVPRERVAFAFADDAAEVPDDDANDSVRATLPRERARMAVVEEASDATLDAPPEPSDEERAEEQPQAEVDDGLAFPNEDELALHEALDDALPAPRARPAPIGRPISLVQPPDGSLRVEMRFATPALFVAYHARYLAEGVVYVPTRMPPRTGTALQVRMTLPDGGVVAARALVSVKPEGAPRTGCIARLVDPDERLGVQLAALARALSTK